MKFVICHVREEFFLRVPSMGNASKVTQVAFVATIRFKDIGVVQLADRVLQIGLGRTVTELVPKLTVYSALVTASAHTLWIAFVIRM